MTPLSADSECGVRVLHGPSLFSNEAAVVIEFSQPGLPMLEPAQWLRALAHLRIAIDEAALTAFREPGTPFGLHHVVAAIVRWLESRAHRGMPPLMTLSASARDGVARVAATYLDPVRAETLLRAALMMARMTLRQCEGLPPGAEEMAVYSDTLRRLLTPEVMRPEFRQEYGMFLLGARRKGIPATCLSGTARVLLLGQGVNGRLLYATSNDRDAWLGVLMAQDKAQSNRIVERLGYPSVRHRLVDDEQAVREAVRSLGFPLVVKPVDSGKGAGVFAGLTCEEECVAAWREARVHAGSGVLVESHVAGDDHRLTVSGGRLVWVLARRPASVRGDGQRSIRALVQAENERRASLPPADRAMMAPVGVDAEMAAHLAKSGLTLESVPAAGQLVVLRSVANLSRGGVFEDVTDSVHPDNRAMAETLAATFRMDVMGVDYITTDISRSWREVGGAIIEVNKTPAAGTTRYVSEMLDRMFPDKSRTRVPYLLFANDPEGATFARWFRKARDAGRVVGVVTASSTAVDDQIRGRSGQSLNDRMQSLIIDPRVQILMVRISGEELEREGILLDRIDHAFIGPGLEPEVEALIHRNASRVSVIDGTMRA